MERNRFETDRIDWKLLSYVECSAFENANQNEYRKPRTKQKSHFPRRLGACTLEN